MKWENLAPDLVRQRIIIEETTDKIVKPDEIKKYLKALSKVVGMVVLSEPVAYTAHEDGYGGWIHWKTSGAHFYSYETTPPLFTVDCYTCKEFSVNEAVEFTKKYFDTIDIVWKEIKV
jgi:S-adenosylmethionine decarboxylase|tara:strand:- start:217 stop:570 length:354 start_codon:yes stop_codon:yes gene_type:complete